jgi:hypothetical protein
VFDRKRGKGFNVVSARRLDGRDYGAKNAANPETLKLINNYNWLESRFIKRYGIGIARPLGAAEETTFLPT